MGMGSFESRSPALAHDTGREVVVRCESLQSTRGHPWGTMFMPLGHFQERLVSCAKPGLPLTLSRCCR